MSTSLFLNRLHGRRPSLPFNLTTPFAASIYRLFSAATTQAPPPNPHFAVYYLIQSCGLPSDKAIRASMKIQHLKCPDTPDAVLRFLRQTGVSESDIRTAVSRNSRILCSSVEKNWRPNIAKLQEVGFSTEDISGLISRSPAVFQFNIVPKVDFWIRVLGSVKNVSALLTRNATLLCSNLEKVIMPNLCFLQEQCGLSVRQIFQLIMKAPRLISSSPEALEIKAKKAEELGFIRAKPIFVFALAATSSLSQSTIDAKILKLKSFGFSQEEVETLIRNDPRVLMKSEELIGRKLEFLLKEAGCDKLDVVRSPRLFIYDLEKRIIPRNVVRKLLMSKGIPTANKALVSFVANLNEKRFLEEFVLPYEDAVPGLHRAYTDACSGTFGAISS